MGDPLAILIHGFANPAGRNTTDRFRPFFEARGIETWEFDYWNHDGWWSFLPSMVQVGLANEALAYGLSRFIKLVQSRGRKVIVVAHSNGAAIAYRASHAFDRDGGPSFPGAQIDSLVLFNPALDANAKFGRLGGGAVFYTPYDIPTRLSRYTVGLFSKWGQMGATGAKAEPRLRNIDMSTIIAPDVQVRTHSGAFSPEIAEFYAEWALDEGLAAL